MKLTKKPKNPLYNHPAYCFVCGNEFLARFNVGDRAKVCTDPDHGCKKVIESFGNGKTRTKSCKDECCRSQYRAAASAQAMDQAIDESKFLLPDEFDKVIKETRKVGDPIGIALRFIAGTGCRLNEALLVRHSFFVLSGPLPKVRIPTLKRKGRPLRSVDLHDAVLVSEIREWIKKVKRSSRKNRDPDVFQMSSRSLQYHFSDILDRLKIKKDSCIHVLRHTRASQLVSAKVSWNYVRQQLGWSSLEMAGRYTHTNHEERMAISKSLPSM